MNIRRIIVVLFLCVTACLYAQSDYRLAPVTKIATGELIENFKNPPGEAGMSCYWWWLNGVATKESITNELEEMKAKGYGSASLIDAGGFNEVSLKPGKGALFLSPEWMELFRHAVSEADRLGMSLAVNVSSGWNPGGPYITPEYALKKLTYSETDVIGGKKIVTELIQPDSLLMYKDVCVQAVRKATPGSPLRNDAILHWSAKAFYSGLGFQEIFPLEKLTEGFDYNPGVDIIKKDEIIDLTPYFDGKVLKWDAPAGEWTILRYGWTCTRAHTSTTSDGWFGQCIDHLNPDAFELFNQNVLQPIIQNAKQAGNSVRFLLSDSWEMGMVNWTNRFPEEFMKFRGYDITPYLPVMTGRIVESPEISNRFLQDLRRTVSDCIRDYHYKLFKEVANENGMLIDPEAGGPCYTPVDALEMLGVCDIPHGEYWTRSPSHMAGEGARLSVRQSACAAHTTGKRFVEAEGPTSIGPHWERSPKDLKGLIDRTFCSGVNRLVWHTYTSSPQEYGVPGIEYFAGTHLNHNTTWWQQAGDFVGYIDRCSYLLQQGLFVADVLYYNGDDVPNMVFLKEEVTDLEFGYDWDKCSKDVLLNRVSYSDGKIRLPDGMSYHVLVLPSNQTMDLEVLRKIEKLVLQGMVVIGDPPVKPTGLSYYPQGDQEFNKIVNRMWRCNAGSWLDGVNRTENNYGKGRVIRGQEIKNVLRSMSVVPDMSYTSQQSGTVLDYIHRATEEHDIYFITNRFAFSGIDDYFYRYMPVLADRYEQVECKFRVTGKIPEFWNPQTGEITPVVIYREENGYTCIPIHFKPEGSVFVVFRNGEKEFNYVTKVTTRTVSLFPSHSGVAQYPNIGFERQGNSIFATIYNPGSYDVHFSNNKKITLNTDNLPSEYNLTNGWSVRFDSEWGKKESVAFDRLKSWTDFKDPLIRYYSGKATYTNSFVLKKHQIKQKKIILDLGNVQDMGVICINGNTLPLSWYAPFEVDITPYAKEGENTVSVDVINLWANRLIGDGKLPQHERMTQTNIKKFDQPDAEKYLRVSGLLGPVKVKFFERIELNAN